MHPGQACRSLQRPCERVLVFVTFLTVDLDEGLGRALVSRAIAEAEARGIRALYLLTTTAERYFPSFGFERVERDAVPAEVLGTAEFRHACPATATAMCRPLAHRPA